jgi:hypothetical protein
MGGRRSWWRRGVRPVVLLVSCAALAACFESEEQFITPQNADYPLPATATVERYIGQRNSASGDYEFVLDKSGKLKRDGNSYDLVMDDDIDSVEGLLFKKIGEGRYVAQIVDSTPSYGLIEIREGRVYAWDFDATCQALSVDEVARFALRRDGDDCYVESFAQLAELLTFLAAQASPDTYYVMK